MTTRHDGQPLLNSAQAAFLRGPVSISAASRDAGLAPSLARVYGCRVSADRREVVLFFSRRRSAAVLRDLQAGSPIAVVFSRPGTHETLQLKAPGARIRPLAPRDRALMRAYGAAFAAEIRELGYLEDFAQALMAPTGDEALAVAFTPAALFEQTPGPHAGRRLEPQP